MPIWATILISITGSAAVFGFVEFLIKRHDNKKGIMAQLIGKVDKIATDLEDYKSQMAQEQEENRMITARTSILRFSDELLNESDREHSKEYFDQIMRDIDCYEAYCNSHKDFRNNVAEISIRRLKEVYFKRFQKHDFAGGVM